MKRLSTALFAFALVAGLSQPFAAAPAAAATASQSLGCGLGGTQTETVTGTAPSTVVQGTPFTVDLEVAQATTAGGAIKNLTWYFQAPTGSSIVAGSASLVGSGSGALGAVSTVISGSVVQLKAAGEIPNGGVFKPPVLRFQLNPTGAVGTNLQMKVQSNPAYSLTALGTINISCTANNPIQAFTSSTIITAPGAPTIGSATAGNAEANLTWTAPASNGGSAVTGYVVTPYIGAAAQTSQTFNSAATAQTVTGLTNGQTYTFKVAATNAAGTGAQSAASNAVTPVAPATVPSAPTAVTAAVAGSGDVLVSWTAPSSDGGSALTGYEVTPYIGAVAQTAVPFASTATSQHLTGLANGTAYTFRVAAVNGVGTGATSDPSNEVTPSTVPDAPTDASAVAGDAQATVSWTAPAADGGSPITGYEVTPYLGAVAQTPQAFNSTATTQDVTGLTNGQSYTFTVAAVNATGTGGSSSATNAVTPFAPIAPGAPTIGAAVAGNTTATVAWTAPADNGGPPITGYVVTPYIGAVAQAPQPFNSTATTQTVTGLTNGTAYTFRVAAANTVGTGAESADSNAVTPSSVTAPGAPTIGNALPGNGQATVSWSAPGSNGGSAINGYVVTPYVGATPQPAVTFNTTGTTQTITGLANGTTYTFKVAAKNAIGTGAQSAESVAVTAGAPSAPGFQSASPGNASAKVAWTAPNTNGSAITGYAITPFLGAVAQPTQTFNTTATNDVVTGLTNGSTYTFSVRAINGNGTGAPAVTAPIVVGTPTAPAFPRVVPGTTTARVIWSAGLANGGPILGYVITPYIGNVAQVPATFNSTALSQTVSGLTSGTNYSFKVAAFNAIGTGPASQTAVFTEGSPAQPGFQTAAPANASAKVKFTTPPANSSPITSYTVWPVQGSTVLAPQVFATPAATTLTVTGLTNGTTYSFRVAATNAVGTSPYSVTNTVTAGAPTGPGFPSAQPGDTTAKVAWSPSTDNGSPITSYVVTPYVGSVAKPAQTFLGTGTSVTVTGLTNGLVYSFRVVAKNAQGTSPEAATTINILEGSPTSPGFASAAPLDASAKVAWQAPSAPASAPVTSYIITPYIGTVAQAPRTFASTATNQIVTGLVNGTTYTFRVAAVNSIGTGSYSTTAAVKVGVPSTPTSVTAVAGVGSATVTWVAPAANGSAITGYVVTPYIGSVAQPAQTFASAAVSQSVTGLTAGTAYTFKVAAINAIGTGALSSASNAATPT